MKKIRAIIVEDQDIEKIRAPIEDKFGRDITIIGTADSLTAAFDLIIERQDEIDLIFLDYFLDKSESEALAAPILIRHIKSRLQGFPFPVIMVTNFEKKAWEIAQNKEYKANIIGLIIKDLYLGLQFEEQIENLLTGIIKDRSLLSVHH